MPPGPRGRGRGRRGRGLQGAVSGRHISGGAGRAPGPKASAQRRLRPHVSQSGLPHRSSPRARCFRTPSAGVSAPGRSPGPQAPRPTAQDRPAPHRPPAARAAMGVEGCTKCIKYLLFVFNFVFWVSPGRGEAGRGHPRARRPRVPLGPAEGSLPGRQVLGPPVRAGSGVGGLGPAGHGSGGPLGPSRPLTAGRGAASRVWGPVGVRAWVPAAGPGRLGASGPFLLGDGDKWGRCRLRAANWGCSAPWMLFLGPPCLAGTEGGLEGGSQGVPPP